MPALTAISVKFVRPSLTRSFSAAATIDLRVRKLSFRGVATAPDDPICRFASEAPSATAQLPARHPGLHFLRRGHNRDLLQVHVGAARGEEDDDLGDALGPQEVDRRSGPRGKRAEIAVYPRLSGP